MSWRGWGSIRCELSIPRKEWEHICCKTQRAKTRRADSRGGSFRQDCLGPDEWVFVENESTCLQRWNAARRVVASFDNCGPTDCLCRERRISDSAEARRESLSPTDPGRSGWDRSGGQITADRRAVHDASVATLQPVIVPDERFVVQAFPWPGQGKRILIAICSGGFAC